MKLKNQKNYLKIKTTGLIDFERVKDLALYYRPKLIICGGSAYSRKINFKEFSEIADTVGGYLLA